MYDASAGSWSTGSLSSARSMAAAVSIGHAVYVAGGYGGQGAGTLDVIDVFDAISRRWSVASPSLSVARAAAVGVGVGGAMLFAGGLTKVTNPMNPAHATEDRTATVNIVMLNTSGTCAPCPAGTYSKEGMDTVCLPCDTSVVICEPGPNPPVVTPAPRPPDPGPDLPSIVTPAPRPVAPVLDSSTIVPYVVKVAV